MTSEYGFPSALQDKTYEAWLRGQSSADLREIASDPEISATEAGFIAAVLQDRQGDPLAT